GWCCRVVWWRRWVGGRRWGVWLICRRLVVGCRGSGGVVLVRMVMCRVAWGLLIETAAGSPPTPHRA
ncbi:MAG: hypothetical protein LBD97_05935, partial [Bifidobacteriaceae bacterium]|nr:hypothetical protein [Bifidobacteriaceae bacterium]